VAFLEKMKFMMRVESRLDDSLAVIGRADGVELVDRADLSSLPATHGPPSGLEAYEALRIAAGRPRMGRDNDHRSIPNELGLIAPDSSRAVHLTKGCYRGQETVARVHNLGRPPRRLTLLLLDGSADRLPAHGSDVMAEGRVVGRVGSSARHHELGPVALALVKRNTLPDATLVVDDVAAAQELVVDPRRGLARARHAVSARSSARLCPRAEVDDEHGVGRAPVGQLACGRRGLRLQDQADRDPPRPPSVVAAAQPSPGALVRRLRADQATIDGVTTTVRAGSSIDVPRGALHRLANDTMQMAMVVEVQQGIYTGEDDIERFSDDYGRQESVS
jgi:folate-binding protein YgfZ